MASELLRTLISRKICSKVTSVDLHAPIEPIPDVTYVNGSITSPSTIRRVFEDAKPDVIFHTASPNVTTNRESPKIFFDVNVDGTKLLLDTAKEWNVKAFVFTSSDEVYDGDIHDNLKEDAPKRTKQLSSSGNEYAISKVEAEELVLSSLQTSSEGGMKVVILRPTHLYGNGDTHAIPVALEACAPNKPLVQLGHGENLFDILSTANCASAHILAAQCLLNPSLANGPVHGEAFTISDGPPIKFWDFITTIWSEGRGRDVTDELWVMPEWVVWFLVGFIEWLWWIGTLGTRQPQGREWMERKIMTYVTRNHSYDGSKAERVLGYRPTGDWRENLKTGVRWEMGRQKDTGLSKKKL